MYFPTKGCFEENYCNEGELSSEMQGYIIPAVFLFLPPPLHEKKAAGFSSYLKWFWRLQQDGENWPARIM